MGGASDRVLERIGASDDIVAFGRLERDQALAHTANFDIALYPREKDEGIQAAKTAEYMGLGVPTVSYDYAVTEELRETGAGILASGRARVRRCRRPSGRRRRGPPLDGSRSGRRRSRAQLGRSRSEVRDRDPRSLPAPEPSLRVSVIIPNKNGTGLVGRCVAAAFASGATEVIVVDDGSTDRSPSEAEGAGADLLASPGRGFAAAVNAGARQATGELLLVLNSDCFLEQDALGRLVDTLARDAGLGLCAAALVETDRSPGKSHGPCLTLRLALTTALAANPQTPRRRGRGVEDVEFVPLACAMIRRSAWDEVSGLDERFFFYFEDQDVCRRLRDAGWRLAVDWGAVAVHIGGASSTDTGRAALVPPVRPQPGPLPPEALQAHVPDLRRRVGTCRTRSSCCLELPGGARRPGGGPGRGGSPPGSASAAE